MVPPFTCQTSMPVGGGPAWKQTRTLKSGGTLDIMSNHCWKSTCRTDTKTAYRTYIAKVVVLVQVGLIHERRIGNHPRFPFPTICRVCYHARGPRALECRIVDHRRLPVSILFVIPFLPWSACAMPVQCLCESMPVCQTLQSTAIEAKTPEAPKSHGPHCFSSGFVAWESTICACCAQSVGFMSVGSSIFSCSTCGRGALSAFRVAAVWAFSRSCVGDVSVKMYQVLSTTYCRMLAFGSWHMRRRVRQHMNKLRRVPWSTQNQTPRAQAKSQCNQDSQSSGLWSLGSGIRLAGSMSQSSCGSVVLHAPTKRDKTQSDPCQHLQNLPPPAVRHP